MVGGCGLIESCNLMGVDDLGRELQSMLSDRKAFQREFLVSSRKLGG